MMHGKVPRYRLEPALGVNNQWYVRAEPDDAGAWVPWLSVEAMLKTQEQLLLGSPPMSCVRFTAVRPVVLAPAPAPAPRPLIKRALTALRRRIKWR